MAKVMTQGRIRASLARLLLPRRRRFLGCAVWPCPFSDPSRYGPDSVIVASGDAAVRAAQQATKTIPIIAVVGDIVAAGRIDSLAKSSAQYHGGVSILATGLDAKRLHDG